MPVSLSEEIADTYFRRARYLVARDVPFLSKRSQKKQPGNLDIDVLAAKGNEIRLVSCKRGTLGLRSEKAELERFKLAIDFIKSERKELLRSNSRFVRMYVAEYVSEENARFFGENGVECLSLREVLEKLIELLKKEMGTKLLDGAEVEVLPRLLRFMIKNKMLGWGESMRRQI